MSIKANTIIGLPVVSIETGAKINTIKEVIYDGINNQVKAFVVDEKGWFNGAKIIAMSDIHSIGEDAVMVKTENVILPASQHYDTSISSIANSENFLTKSEVMTESGKKLGRVVDIYFDFPSGIVNSIEVSEGLIENLKSGTKQIHIQDIITIGTDSLIVKDIAESTFEEQGENQGLNKVLSDTKDKAAEVADMSKQKTQEAIVVGQEVAGNIKDKSQEMLESDGVQDAITRTQSVATTMKEKIVETFDQAKENIQSGKTESDIKNATNEIKDNVSTVMKNTKSSIESTKDHVQDEVMTGRINNVIGKTIKDVTIISKNDDVLAAPGEIVTHDLIKLAIENDTLETVLNNAS